MEVELPKSVVGNSLCYNEIMIKILILGGGFGGVRAALDLSRLLHNRGSSIPLESGEKKKLRDREDVTITLIDRNNSQTFQPALYEVASVYGINHEHPFHTKLHGSICIPYSEIFKGKKIEFVQAEVGHIDLMAKHVVTKNGTTIEFDYLVLALGSAVSTFGIPGVEEYAYKFKTIEDSLMLNDKIEGLYKDASNKGRLLPINILICGAGFTGIELAAELSNCTRHVAHKHGITRQKCTAITLIEAAPAILPMISEKERNLIQRRLKKLSVNILTNAPIQEVGPDYVKFKNGSELKGDLIIWSGGVGTLGILKTVQGLELDERGRILVSDFLQAKNHSNVFAVGDNIIFIDSKTQKPIPQMAFLAIEQGRVVAENISRLIKGKSELKKHKPSYDVWIAPTGGKNAVAHVGKLIFSGFLGYLMREIVDLRYFLSILPFFKALKLFFKEVVVFSKND